MNSCLKLKQTHIFFLLNFIFTFVLCGTSHTADWLPVSDMSTARYLHSATLLSDGRVLVTGGINISGPPYNLPYLSSVEFYDPSTNTWTTGPNMTTPRAGHKATLLQDNRVLVTGGSSDNSGTSTLSSTEIYNPSTNSWSTAASMSSTHDGHSATLLLNGRVLVVGGYNFSNPNEELFNPLSNSWSTVGILSSTGLSAHTATLLQNGYVLVAGGVDGITNPHVRSSAHLFNPSTNSWSIAASMTSARYGQKAILLTDGRVLVTGGAWVDITSPLTFYISVELYNPSTDAWSEAASMSTARKGHSVTSLADGRILVAGGRNSTGYLSSSEIYNPSTNFWTSTAKMHGARNNYANTMMPDGRVLVTGGINNNGYLSSAEVYDTSLPDPFPWQLFLAPIIGGSMP